MDVSMSTPRNVSMVKSMDIYKDVSMKIFMDVSMDISMHMIGCQLSAAPHDYQYV